jgi:hypothetical protein
MSSFVRIAAICPLGNINATDSRPPQAAGLDGRNAGAIGVSLAEEHAVVAPFSPSYIEHRPNRAVVAVPVVTAEVVAGGAVCARAVGHPFG